MNNIENFYLMLHRNQTVTLSKIDILQFFKHNFNSDCSKIINNIHDGYGDNFISLLIDKYTDYEFIIAIYNIIDKSNVDSLFWIDESNSWNSAHPVDHMYRLGLPSVFRFIDEVYSRNFNMLYDVSDETDPSCILDHILSNDDLISELKSLLQQYNVTHTEFDYNKL